MKSDAQISRARAYAQAFMNCCGSVVNKAVHDCLEVLLQDLQKHKSLLFLLECPRVEASRRQEIITQLSHLCGLGDSYHKLMNLLIKKKRVYLLPLVLHEICSIYRSENKLVLLYVESAVPLSDEQVAQCAAFFEAEASVRVLVKTRIIPNLIAGIRLRTEELVWEYTIASRLQKISSAAAS